MPAKGQRDRGHHQQAQDLGAGAVRANKITIRMKETTSAAGSAYGDWAASAAGGNFAAQFTKRHHRTGEGHRADEDPRNTSVK